MATYTWSHQGTSDTTIDATDILQFAGGTFDSPVTVSSYQDSTHTETSGGTDKSSGNGPNNNKYISSTQADWGDGTELLTAITDAETTLKINFADPSSVAISNHIFYAYDGTTTTAVPTGVTFQAFESGDSTWTNAEGSAAALSITDSSAATSHDFYIGVSASPESVGEKTDFVLRDELVYS
jgi:hypothetical protein